MAGRLLKLTAVALLWVCALAAPAPAGDARRAPAARPSSAAPLGGVNVPGLYPGARPSEADHEIAVAKALHAKLVRAAIPWSTFEPRGPGQLDPRELAFLDRLMGDASGAGIKVIATVYGTPCWASSAPAALLRRCVPGGWSKANAWPPRNPSDYAKPLNEILTDRTLALGLGRAAAARARAYTWRSAAQDLWARGEALASSVLVACG